MPSRMLKPNDRRRRAGMPVLVPSHLTHKRVTAYVEPLGGRLNHPFPGPWEFVNNVVR